MTDCPLCKKQNFPFMITFCKSHPDHPLIISMTHKQQFTEEEKEIIKRLFPNNKIGWEMKSIPQHVHCHIVPKK